MIGDRSAACSHVGENDVAFGTERQVDQLVEAAARMDIDLLRVSCAKS